MNYNLLDAKWIPVLYSNGTWEQVGIVKAFEDASKIRQVAASNPMDRVALLRFLIAILYWCKGNPTGETIQDAQAPLPLKWFEKLFRRKDCFNLFGDDNRFFQNCQYRAVKPGHTINYLIQEVPTGNNFVHFRHSTDLIDGLCPACCARGLLRLPLFATSGGKGMTPASGKSHGINGQPPLYVFPIGRTLAETLRLSWRRVDAELGTPEWETPNRPLPSAGNIPLLLGMTWLPRQIWLQEPAEPESACISCSQVSRLVRRCAFDGKGSAKGVEGIWNDPHTMTTVSQKGDTFALRAADALGLSDSASGQWSKIIAALPYETSAERLWVAGLASVQNDKYLEAFELSISVSGAQGNKEQSKAIIGKWELEGKNLARKVAPAGTQGKSRKHNEIAPLVAAIRPEAEARAAEKSGELLVDANEAWANASQQYSPLMRAVARSLSPGFTTAALQRRRDIAQVTPNVSLSAKKISGKKNVKGDDRD